MKTFMIGAGDIARHHGRAVVRLGGEVIGVYDVSEKNLEIALAGFGNAAIGAFEEKAPHRLCAYIYDVANAFNSFYHETKILGEEDASRKQSLIRLLVLTRKVLETCIDLLGFSAPDRM